MREHLLQHPFTWLVTGAAGFVGSHLVEALLKLNQRVTGLDNLSTGYWHNLEEVRDNVTPTQWNNFKFVKGDIYELDTCSQAVTGTDYVLHQAALGSVPRSLEDPIRTNNSNVSGFLNMLVAARNARVKRFVYAASSSTYGDHTGLPKVEDVIGKPLSPYAVTKYVNEIYADVFARCYGFNSVGLRYFNVFGPRQDPEGAYAAVIPRWIFGMIMGAPVYIYGDGETSRDFCYVENVVQANLLAATTKNEEALNQVYNVALNERTSLNQLFEIIRSQLASRYSFLSNYRPIYRDFRPGDVRHSQADIKKIQRLLGYRPTHKLVDGLGIMIDWYVKKHTKTGHNVDVLE